MPPPPRDHPPTEEERTERAYRLEVKKYRYERATFWALVAYVLINFFILCATRRILEADTRPYVGAFLHTDYFGTKYANLDFAPGKPLHVSWRYYDYGKLPAHALVRSIVTYSTDRRSRAGPFPNDSRHFQIWPQQVNGDPLEQRDSADGLTNITEATANSIRQRKGFVYVAIEIRYSKYLTLICKEYKVAEGGDIAGNTLPLPFPRLCQDPASNYAD